MGPAAGCSTTAAAAPGATQAGNPCETRRAPHGTENHRNRSQSSILVFGSVKLSGASAAPGAGVCCRASWLCPSSRPTSRDNALAALEEPLSPISSPHQAPTHKFPPVSPLPVGPRGDARADAAVLPAGDTQLFSPRLSANPLSPGLHISFFKSWVM